MKNHQKRDKISVNKITPPGKVEAVSGKIGNAAEEPFCIYNHERHAVGSTIENQDGPDAVCTKDSSWENK